MRSERKAAQSHGSGPRRARAAPAVHRLLATGVGALALIAVGAGSAAAAGSAQFNTQQRLDESTVLFVDVLTAGESITVSTSRQTTVRVFDSQGTPGVDDDGPALSTGTVDNLDDDDPMTGPLANPFRYTPTTPGTYRIALDVTAGTTLDRFDITVTPNSTTDPDPTRPRGRTFSYEWQLLSQDAGPPCNLFCESVATDVNLFALAPGHRADGTDNYVWQLDLGTFAGGGYTLSANALGLDPPFSGISAPQSTSTVTPEYPLYLGYPAVAGSRPVEPPTVTDAEFLDDSGPGADATFSPGTDGIQDSGTFNFTTDISGGNYAISVDVDGGGVFGDPGDVLLIGRATPGRNEVPWDGNDAFGTPVPLGTYQARIQVRGGEFHFIASDVETSGGTDDDEAPRTYNPGLTIFAARAFGDFLELRDTNVFWDDLSAGFTGDNVFDATANTPEGARSGNRANPTDGDGDGKPDGFHTWGAFTADSFGDGRNIDTYVYGLVGESSATFRAADDDLPDADGDGLTDAEEGEGDTDGDGVADRRDLDADCDGIPDFTEGTADSDGDGAPDHLDLDSDGDGIPDLVEAGGADSDGDGRVDDQSDAANGNGWDDALEASRLPDPDSDGDRVPDRLDRDSDNDGVPDRVESGYPPSEFDPTAANPSGPLDSDGDGDPDFLDLDSDDDGLPDLIEAGGQDPDNSGRVADFVDQDGDGWDDRIAANPLPDPDSDGDGLPDRIDQDADGDGTPDGEEAGYDAPFQPGDPGNPAAPADSDGDGIPDHLQNENPAPPPPPPPPPAPNQPVTVSRLSGQTPIEQSIALSVLTYDEAPIVVLGRDDVYADSLSGGPLAAALQAPLLLTDPETLVDPLRIELERLRATRAILLGGDDAIRPAVADALLQAGLDVRRIGGRNRFETSLLVAGALGQRHDEAVVVEGENTDPQRGWPDAMAVSGYASATGRPILLVNRDRLPEETARTIQRHDIRRAAVIGGTAAVSDAVAAELAGLLEVGRIAGATRFETSAAVLAASIEDGVVPDTVYVTTGLDWRNTLTAGPVAGDTGGAVAIIDGQGGADTAPRVAELVADRVQLVVVVGDQTSITQREVDEFEALLGDAGADIGP